MHTHIYIFVNGIYKKDNIIWQSINVHVLFPTENNVILHIFYILLFLFFQKIYKKPFSAARNMIIIMNHYLLLFPPNKNET